MATIGFPYGTGSDGALDDNLVKILYSEDLHMETLDETWLMQSGLIATEEGEEDAFERQARAPIFVKDDFTKERGQRIRLALQKQLTSNRGLSGVRYNNLASHTYGDAGMVGNEELLDLYDLEVVVELLKNATGFDVPEIQNLRTNFSLEGRSKTALRVWMTDQYEESTVDAFVDGNAAHVIANFSGISASPHPNLYRGASAEIASDDDMSASDTLSTAVLRRMWAWQSVQNINPIVVDGKECFVLLAPVYSCNDLDADPDYRHAHENAGSRSSDNPLFTRASHKYGGILVHEYNRVRSPFSGANMNNIYQCMLLGASALVLARAGEPRLVFRKEDDYEDRYGVGIKQVFGCARATFTEDSDQGSTTLNQSSSQWNLWAEASI